MGSTFGGLSSALSGLYAQRRGLDVTGQNIANANTEGYTRQRVNLASAVDSTQPAMYARGSGAAAGVVVSDVVRLRDEFLESRAQTEHGQNAYLADQKQVYGQIETLIGEPSATGLQSQMAALWTSFHDLANRPGDAASRTQLLARAATLTTGMQTTANRIGSVYEATREQLTTLTTDVNTTAATVAELNVAILKASHSDLPTNELQDRRDSMVMRLSELTGGNARSRPDGSIGFTINGSELVSGGDARTIEAVGATRIEDQAGNPVGLRFTDNGAPASASSGQLGSVLETLGSTLPKYALALDTVAAQLIEGVNTQHRAGYDRNGVAGEDLFSGTTAGTIAVAITDPALIAASGSTTEALDGSNADALAALATAAGGADRTYRQFVVDLGVAAQTVNRRSEIQGAVTLDVDAARMSQSGVNLDEEMMNMLTFQRGYEAAAQVMKAMDSMLETLINSVGR